jgi:ssDNA-binding Zn-finger/Zn-ribbon topoisomerase 1
MVRTFVRLLCPECRKDWQASPDDLPGHRKNFSCPACHATRRLAEFARTEHDLATVKQFTDRA